MTMEYADENGIPAIVEGTWRNAATVLDEAANAKHAGRSTHAVVLAVPPGPVAAGDAGTLLPGPFGRIAVALDARFRA